MLTHVHPAIKARPDIKTAEAGMSFLAPYMDTSRKENAEHIHRALKSKVKDSFTLNAIYFHREVGVTSH